MANLSTQPNNLLEVLALPEVETSELREAQFSAFFLRDLYARAGLAAANAWRDYEEAVDNCLPRDQVNELGKAAEILTAHKTEMYNRWNEAQAKYLALQN